MKYRLARKISCQRRYRGGMRIFRNLMSFGLLSVANSVAVASVSHYV